MTDLPLLSTAEVAARLGVREASVYAYVSRGLLSRTRTRAGSRFDPIDVERFAAGRRSRAALAPGMQPGSPLMVLDTRLTLIEDDHLYLRGRDLVELSRKRTFEDVVRWAWFEDRAHEDHDDAAGLPDIMMPALPASATPIDRLRIATALRAASDPFRDEASADNAYRIGRHLLGTLPDVVGGSTAVRVSGSVAERALRSYGVDGDDATVRAVDRALILAIDHDLAVSTLAARVAASARASTYACVSAALGPFDSPLHGGASLGAVRLLRRVVAGDPADAALSRELGSRAAGNLRGVPGYGHPLYRGADPRGEALREAVAAIAGSAPVIAALEGLSDVVRLRIGREPNIDAALAALVIAAGLPDEAGPALFALGRVPGWIAHVVEEYAEPAMRLRPHGRYAGE